MAYALYARGMVELAVATGDPEWRDAAEAAGHRLLELADSDGRAWGLPFAFRELPPHHPYAITSAVACLALNALANSVGTEPWVGASRASAGWLARILPWTDAGMGAAPWYAPGEPLLAHNVAAMTSAALSQAFLLHGDPDFRERAVAAARYVVSRQHASGLWPYAATGTAATERNLAPDTVVDLVHSSYTIDGLILALMAARRGGYHLVDGAVATITAAVDFIERELIAPNGCAYEKVVIADARQRDTAGLLYREELKRRPVLGGRWLVTFPAETRAWGYGAALGAFSRADSAGIGAARAPLERVLSYVLRKLINDPSGRFAYRAGEHVHFPRHESHVFEGVAAAALTTMTGLPPMEVE